VGAGIFLGVAIATLIGFVNGVCVARLRMVSLIESLGMMITLQGGLLAITRGSTITDTPDSYNWIGQATIDGWPIMPLVLLLGLIAMGFTLRRTILGRSLYATGGNAAAALVAGIRVQKIKIVAFTLSGFISGVAG
jgi:simple sugar transport system permease protein